MDDMSDFSSAVLSKAAGGAPSAVTPQILDGLRQTESGGDRFAVNPQTGAMGPYQFMPATVATLRKQGVNFDPFDEAQSRQAAATYLDQLTQKHGGDIRKGLADYGGFVTKDPTGYVDKVLGGTKPQAASQSSPAPATSDGLDDFSSKALTAAASSVTQPAKPADIAPQTGAAPSPAQLKSPEFDLTAHTGTSLLSSIAGGYAGIYQGAKKLIQTGDVDQAVNAGADAVRATQQAGTFQPKTAEGRQMVEQFGSKWNPLNWVPNATEAAGNAAGDALADSGHIALASLVKGAGAAAPIAIGAATPRIVRAGMGKISDLLTPAVEAPRIEPTMNGPKPLYKLVDGKPILVQPNFDPTMRAPAAVPVGGQSGAATGAAPIPMNGSVASARQVVPTPVPSEVLAKASPELQQAVQAAQQKGVPLNQDVLARHVAAETLPVPVKLTEGQATLDPATISAEMNGRGKVKPTVSPDFYNTQGKALVANMDAVRNQVAPNVAVSHPTEVGQALVNEYKAMDAPVVANIDAKYKALRDANGGQFPVDAATLQDNIKAALKKELLTNDAPTSQMGEISRLADDGNMSFEDFLSLRRNLGNIARTSADGNTRTAASIMVRQLEELPLAPEAAGLKPLADAARASARARFQRMESDPAYKASVNDGVPITEPSPIADKFVQNYVINGRAANVKQMKINLANSQQANQLIGAAGADYLSRIAKADPQSGRFLADAFDQGVQHLGPKLGDIFGPQSNTVRQIGNVAKYTTAQPKGSYVNNSNTLTGALSDIAKSGLEGYLNVKTLGVPVASYVRRGFQYRAANQAAQKSVAPGAGIKQ